MVSDIKLCALAATGWRLRKRKFCVINIQIILSHAFLALRVLHCRGGEVKGVFPKNAEE